MVRSCPDTDIYPNKLFLSIWRRSTHASSSTQQRNYSVSWVTYPHSDATIHNRQTFYPCKKYQENKEWHSLLTYTVGEFL